jgi:hypothetical protein
MDCAAQIVAFPKYSSQLAILITEGKIRGVGNMQKFIKQS